MHVLGAVCIQCWLCLDTGLNPMYENAEEDGNFYMHCDYCGRDAVRDVHCQTPETC